MRLIYQVHCPSDDFTIAHHSGLVAHASDGGCFKVVSGLDGFSEDAFNSVQTVTEKFNCLEFYDDRILLVGGSDLKLFDCEGTTIKPAKKIATLNTNHPIQCVTKSPEAKTIFTGGMNQMQIYDMRNPTQPKAFDFARNGRTVETIACSKNGIHVVGSDGRTVNVFDTRRTALPLLTLASSKKISDPVPRPRSAFPDASASIKYKPWLKVEDGHVLFFDPKKSLGQYSIMTGSIHAELTFSESVTSCCFAEQIRRALCSETSVLKPQVDDRKFRDYLTGQSTIADVFFEPNRLMHVKNPLVFTEKGKMLVSDFFSQEAYAEFPHSDAIKMETIGNWGIVTTSTEHLISISSITSD